MSNQTPLAVLWRHRGLILTTFLVFVVVTAVVSKTVEKIYATESTLLISLQSDTPTFDSVQASQAVARSYADIIQSPNIAQQVANRIGGGTTKSDITDAASFEPVAETQLLKIFAEDADPARAKLIADTYATVFIDYARRNLQKTTKASISLADPAPLKTTPARPKPTLYVLLASLIGIAFGVGLAFLRDKVDQRLRTPADVELAFPALAVLARVPRRRRTETSVAAFKEAYRVLRTNIDFAGAGGRLETIAVTSGTESEGKTTTVTNLALVSAELGMRVIVVEGDFRRPTLQKELMPEETESLRPGMSNYLVEAATLDEVVHATNRPNISIVPAGPQPPNPSALLGSKQGRTAVRDLLAYADLVIIDCPPLSIGADASVISGSVDGVVVVVDLESSKESSVRAGVRQLEAVQAPLVGLVLNRDRSAEASSYDYYLSATPVTSQGKVKTDARR